MSKMTYEEHKPGLCDKCGKQPEAYTNNIVGSHPLDRGAPHHSCPDTRRVLCTRCAKDEWTHRKVKEEEYEAVEPDVAGARHIHRVVGVARK